MTNRAIVVGLLLAPALLGCPPSPIYVCDKLQSMSAPDYAPPARAPCVDRLEALRARSSGAYGMCSQCVMNATDRARVAACREQCPGFDDALPTR